jgi:hypothetical protein
LKKLDVPEAMFDEPSVVPIAHPTLAGMSPETIQRPICATVKVELLPMVKESETSNPLLMVQALIVPLIGLLVYKRLSALAGAATNRHTTAERRNTQVSFFKEPSH